MTGLCEDGNEPPGTLKANYVELPRESQSLLRTQYRLLLATGVAQSVKALACRSEVELERGFDPRLGLLPGWVFSEVFPNRKMNARLFNDAVSTTRLFSVDELGDSEMVFGEVKPRIRHRLPGIHLTVGENLEKKTQPGVELTDEGMYGLCLRVVSKMTPKVPKEMIWYIQRIVRTPEVGDVLVNEQF
ncbi:hypothetical protein ANN_22781 [Periplaneta americana]|uniref:Uncharacterized protein n=1 Tax=Periplaneta americana TaxID=6978 RepID=A0ABQ8SJA9_PERAM|nr:hypothetical protein ANN_22781 [Periplaneta americana]